MTCRVTFLANYALLWLSGSHLPWALPIVLWAVATAVSRCLMGRHFFGDVLAGLLVGIVTTVVVTQVCTWIKLNNAAIGL